MPYMRIVDDVLVDVKYCYWYQMQNKILQGILLYERDGRFYFGLTKPQIYLNNNQTRHKMVYRRINMTMDIIVNNGSIVVVCKFYLFKRMLSQKVEKRKIKFCKGSPLLWERGRLNLRTSEIRNCNKQEKDYIYSSGNRFVEFEVEDDGQ